MTESPRIGVDLARASALRVESSVADVRAAREELEAIAGRDGGMTGWLELPRRMADELDEIEAAAARIRERELLVVVGIGGSYLGSRALIELLREPCEPGFEVMFAGHQLDADFHEALLKRLVGSDFAVDAISKSGTTTEPGIAFRHLWRLLRERWGDGGMAERVLVTTDPEKGALRELAEAAGLRSFAVPADVGGRFSVLSPVGLVPIAAAGIDVRELLAGAAEQLVALRDPERDSPETNPSLAYAAFRAAAWRASKRVEMLAFPLQRMALLAEWWKQLFGESEGKQGRGLLPASLALTTDLHSLGQWMQQGPRIAVETAIDVESASRLTVPEMEGDRDGLGHVAGKRVHDVNRAALEATLDAHRDGGVPCCRIELPAIDARSAGALIAFFEHACALSALALGVDPFDQPGVEDYKRNMHRLLDKPGY
ncbi:MAG: glucose-6-phosphate isomerase [Polyangia bacterium]